MPDTIFAALKQDHDRHRALFAQIAAAGDAPDRRAQLFEELRLEVTAHAAAEEETLYATMLARPDLRHDAQHSVAEHKEIDDLLDAVAELDPRDSGWSTKFDEMRGRYEHHIEEEESDMFPAAEQGLSDEKVQALAALFERRKPAERARAEAGVDADDHRE